MAQTIYRPVPGYTDLYAGMDGTIIHAERGKLEQKIWKNKGYQYVNIPGHGAQRVYSLMAAAYLGPRPEGAHVRHADGSKTNNSIDNLCYGTPSDNQQDSVRHGTQRNIRKTACPSGHVYTPENTYINPTSGHRMCRTCQREHTRRVERKCRTRRHGVMADSQKDALLNLVAAEPGLSNRAIAKRIGVSHTTVRRYRTEGGD